MLEQIDRNLWENVKQVWVVDIQSLAVDIPFFLWFITFTSQKGLKNVYTFPSIKMFKPPTCYYSWTVLKDKIFKRYTRQSRDMLTIAAQISAHDKWRELNITTPLLLRSFQPYMRETFHSYKHCKLLEDMGL